MGFPWCIHHETIKDDEGQEVCVKCGAVIYRGPLRECDFWDFADRLYAQGGGSGLPPSFQARLEDDD